MAVKLAPAPALPALLNLIDRHIGPAMRVIRR
jgi:hypothetical protein